jgi:hypothetical protein
MANRLLGLYVVNWQQTNRLEPEASGVKAGLPWYCQRATGPRVSGDVLLPAAVTVD